jgi:hypothetical protein
MGAPLSCLVTPNLNKTTACSSMRSTFSFQLNQSPELPLSANSPTKASCSADFFNAVADFEQLTTLDPLESAKKG